MQSATTRHAGTAVLVIAIHVLVIACARGERTTVVDQARLEAADSEGDNWLTYGRDYAEQRFSPLADINVDNVGKLGLAWYADLDTHRGQESSPLAVDGVLYTTSAWSKVQAFDAASGKRLWQYDPKVPGATGAKACCDVVNRGAAIWNGKLFVGALDGRLIALDAKTGAQLWSVMTVDASQHYTITGAPRVVKGKVIIGNGGAEFGVRGYVSAYDAETGKLAWRFYTVPGDPSQPFEQPILEQAAATWTGEWWKGGGGGTVWDAIAYDPELDLLYIGVGNGSPWNQRVRSPGGGDNWFLSSIVALRPDTGEYVWHFQTTPGETWDYTATQSIVLADLEIGDGVRKVLMQAPKNGFFYVIDRTNGEFISARSYVDVNWATGVDPGTGRPIENPAARYYQTGKPSIQQPGPFGGHNWQPMAYSPRTGLVYIPANDMNFPYVDDPDFVRRKLGVNLGVDGLAASLPQNESIKAAVKAATRGHLAAWDPVAQREVWRVQYKSPWNGGTLATAGGLVFEGTATGELKAYRADTGKELWSFFAQTGVMAPPVTYRANGVQYVSVVAGWGGAFPAVAGEVSWVAGRLPNRSRVLTFKSGGTAKLPADKTVISEFPPPPRSTASAATILEGKKVYHEYCYYCHGDAAVSGGVLPDLRHSTALRDAALWASIVRKGTLVANGMIAFGEEVSAGDAEAVRAYVIERANESRPSGSPPPSGKKSE
jgi:alcohol dehydrogenase (cytochrome c)/quinohemoprotein ethanol dehydrogenase